MRLLLFLFSVSLLAQQPTARIEGRVVDAQGKPVPRATVMAGLQTDRQPVAIQTADDGTFLMDKLAPGGGYILAVSKPGYLPGAYGGTPALLFNSRPATFSLEAGETLSLTLRLAEAAVITGRVTDQSGDPVVGAIVVAQQSRYQYGGKTAVTVSSAQTNDQGEFRIANLPAGQYNVLASDSANSNLAPSSGSMPSQGNLPTYFGGASDPKRARAVETSPGNEFRADILLIRAPLFAIRGKLVDEAGAPLPVRGVFARRSDGAQMLLRGLKMTDAKGDFALTGLSPGEDTLESAPTFNSTTGEPMPVLVGSTRVTIGAADVNDAILRTSAGGAVRGSITVEGAEWKVPPPSEAARNSMATVNARLLAGENFAGLRPFAAVTLPGASLGVPRPAVIGADGGFQITGVGEGEYQLTIGGLPEDHYLKSVFIGDSDVTHSRVALPGGSLQVLLSAKAASVSGAVARDGLTVMLWPVTADAGRAYSGIRATTSGKAGTFRFAGLAPGEYRIAAFDTPDAGALWNHAFVSQFAPESVLLQVDESAKVSAEPKLVSPERFQQEFEKLP